MIQTETDASIGIDRKAWNGLGNTSSNSDGYAHDFTLPARTNPCQQITGIRVEISLGGYTNNNVCPHFTNFFNLFYGCTSYAGGATCLPATNLIAEPNYPPNTSPPPFNFGSPLGSPLNSNIIPDFGDNLSIDIIPVSNPGCYPVTNGYISYQYTITVIVTVTDIIPNQPPTINCWDNWVFNPTTCIWDNTGTQPTQPPVVDCWDNYVFNTTTCVWENTGSQPTQPPVVNCWDNWVFNPTTCIWDNTGTQPTQPLLVNCWDNYIFNTTTCVWENTGSQPTQPPVVNCWDNWVFNSTTCIWDNNGIQPVQHTTACYETATFNTSTCVWDVIGTQPVQPTLACWETATFNNTTCSWDITGTQPIQPTLACYETTTFNTSTCVWDVVGSPPIQPNLPCWEIATLNDATCSWEVTGTQPIQPNLECWETAIFNTITCSWDVTGTQPGNIIEENLDLCENTTLNLLAQTNISNPTFIWSTGAITNNITINRAGTFTVDITGGVCSFETRIFNVILLEKPIIENVISDGNDIIITTSKTGDFIYSLDGNIFQSSNVFSNAEGGLYNIFVKQQNCISTISLQYLHFYIPKFFTPNNDGVKDTFSLAGIEFYSSSEVSIFDRYGKLLKFSKNSPFSWDGTFRGENLPSDDYWYVIIIEGKKFTGHFTLKR